MLSVVDKKSTTDYIFCDSFHFIPINEDNFPNL